MAISKTVSGHGKSTANPSAQPKGSVKDRLGLSKEILDKLEPRSQSVGRKNTQAAEVKRRLFSTARKEKGHCSRVEDVDLGQKGSGEWGDRRSPPYVFSERSWMHSWHCWTGRRCLLHVIDVGRRCPGIDPGHVVRTVLDRTRAGPKAALGRGAGKEESVWVALGKQTVEVEEGQNRESEKPL